MTAARSMGDWQLALMIAARYSGYEKKSDITTRSESGNDTLSSGVDNTSSLNEKTKYFIIDPNVDESNISLDPKRIAYEIVSAFKESLEQGESGIFDNITSGETVGFGDNAGVEITSKKAFEAAQISLDYCNDVESAVTILLLSSEWLAAAEMALKKNRKDLLIEEVREDIPNLHKLNTEFIRFTNLFHCQS